MSARAKYEPNTLLERDRARLAEVVIADWHRSAMETLGPESRVEYLMLAFAGHQAGGLTSCDDGPYSDGKNTEWWSFQFEQCRRGFRVNVTHSVRGGVTEKLRAGLVTWREVVDRAMGPAEPEVGEQLRLDVAA